MATTYVGRIWDSCKAGPDEPPSGARTLVLHTWGGGQGTFWQVGDQVGMIWRAIPQCGFAIAPSSKWSFCTERLARRHFDVLEKGLL